MSARTFTADWLMQQDFPPVQYVVEGIIPEGLTLLTAAPKIGKSWMALGIAIELSNGGNTFGFLPVEKPRPVLYLALEDRPESLQGRIQMMQPDEVSYRLTFCTDLAESKVLDVINAYMEEHADLNPVVILDTLGKVMPPAGNGNQYGHDYRVMSELKRTTDAVAGSSLLILHHTRKMGSGDFLDSVSGTQGIAGAADTVIVLRRERGDRRATMQVTSRSAAEGEYALTLNERHEWILDGHDLTSAAQSAETARQTVGLGDRMVEVITTIGRFPEGITPRDLKTLMPDLATQIDVYLQRAVEGERILKLSRGLYAPVSSVSSVSFGPADTNTSNASNTPLEGVAA